MDTYRLMREENQFLDGQLIAEGVSFPVHLSFMAAHSTYLRQLFTDLAPNREFEFKQITSAGRYST